MGAYSAESQAHWPAPRNFKKATTGEEKAADVAATARTAHPSPDTERFSSWKRLWRATARELQFLQLYKKREKVNVCKSDLTWKITHRKGTKTIEKQRRSSKITEWKYIPLDNELLEQAETLLLKRSQDNSFREDIKRLQQGKQLEGSSKLKRLDVVLEEGLLRLKGRIDAIQGVTRDYKRPIVLDSKDKTTQLIIEEFHCCFNHGNHATKATTGEEKAADVAATARTAHPSPDTERFSSWKRLWRATARVLQFLQLYRKREKVNVCKNDLTWKITQRKGTKTIEKQRRSSETTERKYIPLDNELLEQAETLLLKRSQDNSFREDIKRLQHGKQLQGSSKFKRLDVVLEEGLLRLKGRIDAIQGVTRDYKRPIVLDSKDKTTQLIIEEFHCRFNHGNHATIHDDCGELHGISQQTMSRLCKRVGRALASKSSKFIKLSTTLAEQNCVQREFAGVCGFSHVIEAIDCTHVKIRKVGGETGQYFVNRKGHYSINTQIVCGPDLTINDELT
ncbi:unnamed protein product [Parnassius apollo]|uniref:(apollo) hypothetical protein n=1 Tax=Parnassius apollo TaxID=110799 RepID=A0A8S3XZL3_PARAO|nr:unnamed protein product [Parnassius apollo]